MSSPETTINGMPARGRCAKCGRLFLTLPRDGKMVDRYIAQGIRIKHDDDLSRFPLCSGRIEPLEAMRHDR